MTTEARVRAIIERVERLDEEIAALNADKAEVYAEAKGDGFDTKALKAVVRERRKDEATRAEEGEMFSLYWSAVHGTGGATRAPAHESP